MGWGGYGDWGGFREYVPVAQKRANAVRHAAQVAKKQGRDPSPVKLDGKKIATTFWGKAWCDNLAAYSDYANRLPRGATYVRNGSVVDLVIKPRSIEAIVAGSETYEIHVAIDALAKPTWKRIKQDCSASIDSLLDLLAGRFSDGVMQRLTAKKDGLFPSPGEIKMECSCPDWSYCCKHLAAVMYGVGARLDKQPDLLFVLRDVDHQELVSQAVAEGNLDKELTGSPAGTLASQDLGAIFGIELETTPAASAKTRKSPRQSAAAASSMKTKKREAASVPKLKTKSRALVKPSRTPAAITLSSKRALDTKKPATKKRVTAKRVVRSSPDAAVDVRAKRQSLKRSGRKSA